MLYVYCTDVKHTPKVKPCAECSERNDKNKLDFITSAFRKTRSVYFLSSSPGFQIAALSVVRTEEHRRHSDASLVEAD
jgi:hypothetical protein